MVGCWASLYVRQKNGEFITGSLQVQFGDEVYGTLQYAFFSGLYQQAADETIAQRPVYYERGMESNRTSGRFFYCQEEEVWVFSIANVSKSLERDTNGCQWLLRSLKTDKYDLAEVSTFGWKIWTGRVQQVEFLQMFPADCSYDSDCNYHGKCLSDGSCECDDGWLGKYCRFEDALCQNIVFYIEDTRIQTFSILLGSEGEILTSYERPVYYSERPDGRLLVILFTGRRYFKTAWGDNLSIVDPRLRLSSSFFHAYWLQIYEQNMLSLVSQQKVLRQQVKKFDGTFLVQQDQKVILVPLASGKVPSLQQCIVKGWTVPFL